MQDLHEWIWKALMGTYISYLPLNNQLNSATSKKLSKTKVKIFSLIWTPIIFLVDNDSQ